MRHLKRTLEDERYTGITIEDALYQLEGNGAPREPKPAEPSDEKKIRKELSRGIWLNVGPNRSIKLEPFMINDVNDLKGDRIVLPNRYLDNPYYPQKESNVPNWNTYFITDANRTPEFFNKFGNKSIYDRISLEIQKHV